MKVRMSVEQQSSDEFLNRVIEKYNFSGEDRDTLRDVYEQLMLCIEPYAAYRINQRVIGVRQIDDGQSAIVAMTLGIGVDRLAEKLVNSENEAYMLDCLANELMLDMYGEFNRAYARFHRRYVQRYVFIGDEIPITVVPSLLAEIKGRKPDKINKSADDTETSCDREENIETGKISDVFNTVKEDFVDDNDITSDEHGVLSPSKSVVFYAILSENPSVVCESI